MVGDPGSGQDDLSPARGPRLVPDAAGRRPATPPESGWGSPDRTFPVLVRLSELAQHLAEAPATPRPCPGKPTRRLAAALPGGGQPGQRLGLDSDFFRQQLEAGLCTVLLDGLDEAPDRPVRNVCRGSSRTRPRPTAAAGSWSPAARRRTPARSCCRVLPKPASTRWRTRRWRLPDPLVRGVVRRRAAMRPANTSANCWTAVRARPEIRRMARNPVMLTALAVVHWNERRLPEQRADLYDSIITWLSRSREQRPGRATADESGVLQELALAMQDDTEGRKTPGPQALGGRKNRRQDHEGRRERRQGDRRVAGPAERFLDEEEVDSGIIVGAARSGLLALDVPGIPGRQGHRQPAGREQQQILFADPDKMYSPDGARSCCCWPGSCTSRAEQGGRVYRRGAGRAGSERRVGRPGPLRGPVGQRAARPGAAEVPGRRPAVPASLDAVDGDLRPREIAERADRDPIAAADALGQAGDPRIDFRRDDYWVTIPAGKFLMGAQSKDPQEPNYDHEARR